MNNTNTGGPAFSCKAQTNWTLPDMTPRDYFAAKAMAAITAIPDHWYQNNVEEIAEAAYALADAMLRAREEK